MAKFYYARTHRTVEIPDDIADQYIGRKWYTLIEAPITVPDGTISEILEWVGDDENRRRVALQAEQIGKQRTTLLDALAENQSNSDE